MRIDLLLVRHPSGRISPLMPEIAALLEGAGVDVHLRFPDELSADEMVPPADDVALCVLKAKTPAALVLAERYHAAGIATFNPYPVTELCRDKVATTRVLENAGIPVPSTWTVDDPAELPALLADGPLIMKPLRGSQGQGISIVHSEEELAAVDLTGETYMAQRYLPPDGRDRKIYRIGDEVFCVERIWPPVSYEDKLGRLIDLSPEVEQVARDCGPALGIDTYGVDIIEHQGRPYVIDLSSFPGFKGVPDAARRLTDRLLRAAG